MQTSRWRDARTPYGMANENPDRAGCKHQQHKQNQPLALHAVPSLKGLDRVTGNPGSVLRLIAG